MRVQIHHISVHGILHGFKLRIAFHLARRIRTTAFHAFHAEKVVVVTRKLRRSPAAFGCSHGRNHAARDDIHTLKESIPRHTTRVPVPAQLVALRDIFQTRALGWRPAAIVLFGNQPVTIRSNRGILTRDVRHYRPEKRFFPWCSGRVFSQIRK